MAGKSTNTEVATAATTDGDTTSTLAARRRQARRAPSTAAVPTGEAPAPVAGEAPVSVIASRTLVAGFGSGGPARPVGGVWNGKPLVVETSPSGFAGVVPEDPDYVIADCDAQESMTPPGCYTPVNRTLWMRGMRVRRDLYEAVMAAHAQRAATGTAHTAPAAELPAGITDVPADVIAAQVPGEATAGTTVVEPIVLAQTGNHVTP